MIAKLAENRAYRTYMGGSRIDALVKGEKTEDTFFPEDWLASTVRAFNPGRENIVEGLGKTEDGRLIADMVPQGLPVLVKLLDAAERLVIQVHPTRAFAKEAWNSDFGKTESWFILEADEDACVYIGFTEDVTKEKWIKVCEEQDVPAMLNYLHCFNVKKGDCIFVPGGVPHAIGGGCLMLETQEPTDLMVVPERKTPRGIAIAEKKIHGGIGYERMYDCFEYDGMTKEAAKKWLFHLPEALNEHFSRYLDAKDNGIFSVLKCETKDKAERVFEESFAIAVIMDGEGKISLGDEEVNVKRGDRLLMLEMSGKPVTIDTEKGISLVMSMPKA